MIASQLLYTSWKNGNSTTKGYMVYSKSKDINEAEVADICAVMKYKAPNNLPYTPSDEEIETLFPKMFAYFKLSSGRFCIAQSSYIGQDYTNRWGNYIIHAYVLDDIGDLVPSKMIGASIFRTRLTEEELNADSAPESLPRIELENNGSVLTEQEVNQFFARLNRREVLKGLAQCVYNSVLNNKRIQFIDDLSNMRTWITALSMVIPGSILSRMYFNTYAIDRSQFITIACKSSTESSNTYEQAYLPNDVIVIDAARYDGKLTPIGCYFDVVCDDLIDGYYDGILCSNNISKSMRIYHCDDCDLAYKLTYVQQGKLDYVSSNTELLNIISLLTKYQEGDMTNVFNTIYEKYINSDLFVWDASSIAILKLLYPCLTSEYQADMLMRYVDKKLNSNKDASTIYAEIRNECPCNWDEAVKYFLRQSFREHFEQHLSDAAALLLCNSWITVVPRCKGEQQQRALDQICSLYAREVTNRNMQAINCILDCCMNVDEKLYHYVYRSVNVTILNKIGQDEKYLFEYLKLAIDKGDLFWEVLIKAVMDFPTLERCYIQQFVALRETYNQQVANLARYAEKYSEIRDFMDNVEVYAFENAQIRTLDDLIDVYIKYIKDGRIGDKARDNCKDVFFNKVSAFLKQCDEKESMKNAIELYRRLYYGKEIFDTDRDILGLLSSTIYNDDRKNITQIDKCLSKVPYEVVDGLKNACSKVGLDSYPRAILIDEGHCFKIAAIERKDKAVQAAQNEVQKMFDEKRYLFLSNSCSGRLLAEFLNEYMDVVLKGMYRIFESNSKYLNASDVIDYFLVSPSKLYSNFSEDIVKVWEKDIAYTNANMKIYFLYIFEKTKENQYEPSAFRHGLRKILEKYLVSIGKSKRNALFKNLTEYFDKYGDASYSKEMGKYIEVFNRDHLSVWDKIKDIFSVKEDEKNGKKNKN